MKKCTKNMLKKEATKITGGLSAPGKMPEGSYNLPASMCQTGAKLREIPKARPAGAAMLLKAATIFQTFKDCLNQAPGIINTPAMDRSYGCAH